MERKEIILARIADVLSRKAFVKKSNGEIKARLRCLGLNEYYDRYSDYLEPYSYNTSQGRKFENPNEEYSLFLGFDFIFSQLYENKENDLILNLLSEITKSFNIRYIETNLEEDFEELAKLYQLFGLDIFIEDDKVKVTTLLSTNNDRIKELFSVEEWLSKNHPEVYESYEGAISAYTSSHPGTCIESCRTSLVSMFSKYKGTEVFAKWLRGIFNVSGDFEQAGVNELGDAINCLRKEELADFFIENKDGKLTKTKTIYMIYSMMSDYGTHRNEATQEKATDMDALFMLRLTDSILYWVYQRTSK